VTPSHPPRTRLRTLVVLALFVGAASACHQRGFMIADYPTPAELYRAALNEFQHKHWTNAIFAFEKLTNDLGARDTLLPRSYWYLASGHEKEHEYLLAAQSFGRLYESFPDDTLADDAILAAGEDYRRLWRKPALDATYGETALGTLSSLIDLYPTSDLVPRARKDIAELEQWFAIKNYETGMFYFRQHAWDSAIIYFRSVVERWPDAPRARDAWLRLAEAYKTIRYGEDLADACARLRQSYPGDRQVIDVCGAPRASDSTAARATPTR
jgi:outer membrane protein assembly factor BamD